MTDSENINGLFHRIKKPCRTNILPRTSWLKEYMYCFHAFDDIYAYDGPSSKTNLFDGINPEWTPTVADTLHWSISAKLEFHPNQ